MSRAEVEVRKALTDAINRTAVWTGVRVEMQHELVDAIVENMQSAAWREGFRIFLGVKGVCIHRVYDPFYDSEDEDD